MVREIDHLQEMKSAPTGIILPVDFHHRWEFLASSSFPFEGDNSIVVVHNVLVSGFLVINLHYRAVRF